jgi:hypothetical protein
VVSRPTARDRAGGEGEDERVHLGTRRAGYGVANRRREPGDERDEEPEPVDPFGAPARGGETRGCSGGLRQVREEDGDEKRGADALTPTKIESDHRRLGDPVEDDAEHDRQRDAACAQRSHAPAVLAPQRGRLAVALPL